MRTVAILKVTHSYFKRSQILLSILRTPEKIEWTQATFAAILLTPT